MRVEPRRILIVDNDSLLNSLPDQLKPFSPTILPRLISKAILQFKANSIIFVGDGLPSFGIGIGATYVYNYPTISSEWPTAVLTGGPVPEIDKQLDEVKIFFRPNESFSNIIIESHENVNKYWVSKDMIPIILGIEEAAEIDFKERQKASKKPLKDKDSFRGTAISIVNRMVDGKEIKSAKQLELAKASPKEIHTQEVSFERLEIDYAFVYKHDPIVIPDLINLDKHLSKQDSLEFLAFTPEEESAKTFVRETGDLVALDTETTGLNIQSHGNDTIIGVSLASDETKGAYIPIEKTSSGSIEPILEDPSKVKVFHNSKFDLAAVKHLPNYSHVSGNIYDTMIAAYLLGYGGDPEMRKRGELGLKALTKKIFDYEMTLIEDLKNKDGQLDFSTQSIGQLAPYAAMDAISTYKLWKYLEPQLHKKDLWPLFELEMRICQILLKMEEVGVYIHLPGIKKANDQAQLELAAMKNAIYETINKSNARDYDIDSPAQLAELLFGVLGLPPVKSNATGFSTDKETLSKLEDMHEVIPMIKEYKELKTTVNMFLTKLPKHIAPDGRFHTGWNQVRVVTGRLSSVPNLMSIPARGPGKLIRGLFQPRRGYSLVAADFSQLEIRVMTHFSKEKSLIDAYEKEKLTGEKSDIYKTIGAQINQISEDEVTKSLRDKAKILVLGTNYGLSEFGFARRAGISLEEAKQFQEGYFNNLPGIKTYMREQVKYARMFEEARSLLNRIRLLPEINSDNIKLRAEAERHAINMPIQGCLPKTTCVLTPEGWVPIGNFSQGTVWTGESWAGAVRLNRGVAKKLKLTLSDGRIFYCDNRHYFRVVDCPWGRWVHVSEIKNIPLAEDIKFDFGAELDPEDFYWAGRFIGDGHLNTTGWGIAFGSKEVEDIYLLLDWLSKKDLVGKMKTYKGISQKGYNVEEYKGNFSVKGHTQKGIRLWEDLGMIKSAGARFKRIPNIVFRSSFKCREAFFKGYFDADGYEGSRSQKITSCNLNLLQDTLKLMTTIGLFGKISKKNIRTTEFGTTEWYDLRIHKIKKEIYVEEIEEMEEEEMFTLSVDDERHAFSSEGLISKNTASDIVKTAMDVFDSHVQIMHMENTNIILQLHDEIIVETPDDTADEVKFMLQESMEGSGKLVGLTVPLIAEAKVGKSWEEVKGG